MPGHYRVHALPRLPAHVLSRWILRSLWLFPNWFPGWADGDFSPPVKILSNSAHHRCQLDLLESPWCDESFLLSFSVVVLSSSFRNTDLLSKKTNIVWYRAGTSPSFELEPVFEPETCLSLYLSIQSGARASLNRKWNEIPELKLWKTQGLFEYFLSWGRYKVSSC